MARQGPAGRGVGTNGALGKDTKRPGAARHGSARLGAAGRGKGVYDSIIRDPAADGHKGA